MAHATVDALKASMHLPNDAKDAYLVTLLEGASGDVDRMCHRSFAVPSTDVTVYVDITRRSSSLASASVAGIATDGRALDIVSITSLAVRESETDSYTVITAGDTGYYLDVLDPAGIAGTDWPWEDVTLSPAGTYTTWPMGRRAVRIIGRLGFPKVPTAVVEAVLGETRERYRQGPGGGATAQGVNQFGVPVFLTGDAPAMRRITRVGSPFVRRTYGSL